jgi:hypothetical protein
VSMGSLKALLCHGWNGEVVSISNRSSSGSSDRGGGSSGCTGNDVMMTTVYKNTVHHLSEAILRSSVNINFALHNLMLAETRFNFKKHLFSVLTSYVSIHRAVSMRHVRTGGINNMMVNKATKLHRLLGDDDDDDKEEKDIEIEVQNNGAAMKELTVLNKLPPPPPPLSPPPTAMDHQLNPQHYGSLYLHPNTRTKTAAVVHYRPPDQNLATFEVGFRASLELLKKFQLLDATMVRINFICEPLFIYMCINFLMFFIVLLY